MLRLFKRVVLGSQRPTESELISGEIATSLDGMLVATSTLPPSPYCQVATE